MKPRLVIATRGSKLALAQSRWVKERLESLEPGLVVELRTVVTSGDRIQNVPLAKVGGKGLFVKEIEEAILAGEAHLAVHSVKDMPTLLPEGLTLASIPARADRRDALVSRDGLALGRLPAGAKIGTSSLRRKALLLSFRPDLEVISLRGNVDTRLRKMEEGQVEAVVLAAAGLSRLGLTGRITEVLDPELMVPAVGQGALGLECGRDDPYTLSLLERLGDPRAMTEVRAERAFLARLEGGCQVPIACRTELRGESLFVEGLVAAEEGRPLIRAKRTGQATEAADLGREAAEEVLAKGGREILEEIYGRQG